MAANKYEARLLDEDNPWGTKSDEQDQIMAMTAEIKVLEQGNNKGSNSNKKVIKSPMKCLRIEATKTPRRKRLTTSVIGRTQHPKIPMLKKMGFQSGNSRRRSIFGVHIIIMELACRLFTTPRIVKPATRIIMQVQGQTW